MDTPLVSVIVPVYNTEQYLRQCIGTICGQTVCDIEIICIDDGSTDRSGAVLDELASQDGRMTVIHRASASGSAALPRNMGLDIAGGKYVMLLDSDDYFDRRMLEKLLARAEETGADLVMCDNYRVMPSGEADTLHTEIKAAYLPDLEVFSYRDMPQAIFQISNAAAWHKLIRRDLIERHRLRFQERVAILDDIFFVNSLLVLAEKITIEKERLVYYRLERDGAQTRNIHLHKESVFLAFDALNRHLRKLGIYEEVKTSLRNWTLNTMQWWLYACETYSAFAEVFRLYREQYFEELNLLDMAEGDFYREDLARFHASVLGRDCLRSAAHAMDSMLGAGSRIVVYGAGAVGRKMHDEILAEGTHTIVLWCDRNADRTGDPRVKSTDMLYSCEYDAVFIAIGDGGVVEEVKRTLRNMGIDERKIYIA